MLLGKLNQDRDCLVAAGIWNNSGQYGNHSENISSSSNDKKRPKIVLSTRFSLNEESSATATSFAVLPNEEEFEEDKLVQTQFRVYSPNAYNKSSCDPSWTNMAWPCRGTFDTCCMEDKSAKTGAPTEKSCWRYSFRYQLEEAKRSNGFIELDRGVHLTGKGQAIETIMANEVGTKIFRIYEPGSRFTPPTYSRSFIRKDILHLIRRIKEWYKYEGYKLVSADSEIHCKD